LTESEIITGAQKHSSDQALEQRSCRQPYRKKGSICRQEKKPIERKADWIVTVL